jgi:hypothetical protein
VTRDDLLHLLAVYEAVIAARPIGPGNAEFLDVLLAAAYSLAERAMHDSAEPDGLAGLATLVGAQNLSNARELASRLLRVLGSPRRRRASRSLYVPAAIPALSREYRSVTVIFGPGLGMGDEISFRLFVRSLADRSEPGALTVFNLYPGLWDELVPGVRALHYRGHPLRPFLGLDARGDPARRELVVLIDFDGYHLHERLGLSAPYRDVLEIALGLRRAWFVRGGSHWIRVAEVQDALVANNYWVVRQLTTMLSGEVGNSPPWEAIRNVRRDRIAGCSETVVLFNPFSSKEVGVTPDTWARLFAAIGVVLRGSILRLVVFPGTSEATQANARALCDRLAARGISSELMTTPEKESLTPFNAIRALVAALRSVAYCVTIDSFPAHIVPLFGVPTLVVALKDNREFWVPTKHALYVPVSQLVQRGPATLAKLREGLTRGLDAVTHVAGPAERTVASTGAALAEATPAAVAEMSRSLFDYIALSSDPPAVRLELRRWFRFFSRFGAALVEEPPGNGVATAFMLRWSASEAYKYIALAAGA